MPFFKRNSDKQPQTPTTPTSPAFPNRGGLIKRTPSNRSQLSDDLPNGDIGLPASLLQAGASRSGPRPPDTLLLMLDDGDLGKSLQLDSPLRTSSRLSKTFQEILHDKDALPYFIQYMEAKDVGHLIRFWLDAESFQAATWTRIRTQSIQSLSRSSVARTPDTESAKCSDNKANTPAGRAGEDLNCALSPSPAPQLVPESNSTSANSAGADSTSANKASNDSASANASLSESALQIVSKNSNDERVCESGRETSPTADIQSQGFSENLHGDYCSKHSNTKPNLIDNANTDTAVPETESEDKLPTHTNSNHSEVPTSLSSHLTNPSLSSHDMSAKQSEVEERLSQLTAKARSGSQEEKFKKSIERDAVNIYSKYVSLDATKPIGISEEMRNRTISKMCGEDGYVEPTCFAECQDFVVDIMEKNHYPEFMRSVFHCKHQIDVLTSGRVYLADCLYNEAALFYFMEFMEQEGASNLLQFVMAADNFQQHLQALSGYDGVQAQTDAMVLYDKYFSLQATTPLGFSDKIRFEVESNICREEGPLPDCFSIPRNIALKSIEKNTFPQFLQSELYYKYLSELVNTIQMAQDFPQRSRKRTESDASSEHSGGSQSVGSETISMKNTLLASDTRQWKKILNKFEDDLLIDPVLLNPDSLWKRSTTGGMSLGKVDTLGQFVSEFEPEPDHEKKKSSGFFKKRRDKDKEQEEMALRIAQTIISGVTSFSQEGEASGGGAINEGQQQSS